MNKFLITLMSVTDILVKLKPKKWYDKPIKKCFDFLWFILHKNTRIGR